MPPSKIRMELLTRYFEDRPEKVFDNTDLGYLYFEKFQDWNLPRSMNPRSFIQMLLTRGHLEKVHLRSKHYASPVLYSWQGAATPFSVALSLRKEQSFFSHASAMWIHGLSEHHKQIFLNKEQSAKPMKHSALSQESIDRAFQNQQRRSKMTYQFKGSTITLLSGKHTGRMGVETAEAPTGQNVDVTSIERTLIDIAVRPAYSGGVSHVLEAYKRARGRVSVSQLTSLLAKFDYTYPYHQSIGFYLERANYSEEEHLLAKAKGLTFNFYLSHGLRNPSFDPEWRIYFPQSLK
jgi:predicted transcriptional regulator of viral defense system